MVQEVTKMITSSTQCISLCGLLTGLSWAGLSWKKDQDLTTFKSKSASSCGIVCLWCQAIVNQTTPTEVMGV